ncbi:MAG TPA: LptF/LptG family permease [Mariprofundaceae bacterium]|nr:LptF/LptG family permease [Mariprofundaceae bacterium]
MPRIFRWIFYGCTSRAIATLFALLAVFVIIEAFDKARFLGHGLTSGLMIEYLLLKIPFMVSEFMPVILLLAVSIYVTELSHHNELVAMRAAGLGVNKLMVPLLCVAALAATINFGLGEWITPTTNQRLDTIDRVNIHHRPSAKHGVQWLKEGHRFFRLQPLGKQRFRLLLLETDSQGHWLKRIDATSALYEAGTWHLTDVHVSEPAGKEGIHISHEATLQLVSKVGPHTAEPPKPRHMRFMELKDYARELKQAGLASSAFEFALQKKLAEPLSCLIMAILAAALCMHMGSRVSASSMGIVGAIVLGLGFYVTGHASSLLSTSGRLPPDFAAWLPNLIFGGIACFLLLQREGY